MYVLGSVKYFSLNSQQASSTSDKIGQAGQGQQHSGRKYEIAILIKRVEKWKTVVNEHD
jgi:hypothetical protein